jgi:hypothetical protein
MRAPAKIFVRANSSMGGIHEKSQITACGCRFLIDALLNQALGVFKVAIKAPV